MYFLETTEHSHYIRVFEQIVINGMFRGVITNSHIACFNPAIAPSLKAMRYIWMLEQLSTLPNFTENERADILIQNLEMLTIGWLTNQYENGVAPPRIDHTFNKLKQLDIDKFVSAVNGFNFNSPFNQNEIQENKYLQRYFNDDNITYQDQLTQYEWHEKRFSFFNNANFKCNVCERAATVSMISEVAQNDSKSIYFSYNSFKGNNQTKINKAIGYLHSFTLPLLKLNWTFLQHPNVVEQIVLQLHHKYYINDGRKAWEYKDDCYQVLCRDCHKQLHEVDDIPIYDTEQDKNNQNPTLNIKQGICGRCEGVGFIEAFRHVQNGICFQCWGEGYSFQNES